MNNNDEKILENIFSPIKIKNLFFKYKRKQKFWSLNNINLEVQKGEFHAFVGKSGSGKSTTINILIGSLLNYDGTLLINGENPKENYKARKGLSYFSDKPIFPASMTLENYLLTIGSLFNDNKELLKIEINNLLNKYELIDKVNKNPNKFSSGQKQKVLWIKTLLEKPNLIILDEPGNNLDPYSRSMFFADLKKLQLEKQTTIFLTTHFLDQVEQFADFATVINNGEIIKTSKVDNEFLNWISNYFNHGVDNDRKNEI